MGHTSTVVTSGLLILALAAVTLPAATNLLPALLPQDPAAVAVLPAAQLPPTTLSTLTGVAPLSDAAPLPDASALATALTDTLEGTGVGTFSAHVLDAATGNTLFTRDGGTLRIPASNLKLLTAAAALAALGTDTTLTTQVLPGASANALVLRGGGDTLLGTGASDPHAVVGRAGLATLAADTAAALARDGVSGPVTLSIDDTLFTGPALNPKWADGDVDAGEISGIYPLALYGGRAATASAEDMSTAGRPADAALAVAGEFATALEAAGVATTGRITRVAANTDANTDADATADATPLASVASATVAEQVQYLLQFSDNYVTEALARLVSVERGGAGSTVDGLTAVRAVLGELGLNLDGVLMSDACGLATGNQISAKTLAETVALMVKDPGSAVGQALVGLPIAGLSGSLAGRFTAGGTLDGAGLVRAKTGTLNAVSALTGYVINAEGRLLIFSILGNQLTAGPASATPVLDAAATVLVDS